MTSIRKRVFLFALVFGFGMAVCICLFMINTNVFYDPKSMETLLFIFIPITSIPTIIFIREYKKLRIAEVISENQILHIRSSYSFISDRGETIAAFPAGRNILISNFGILLDTKIIKFNQEGIQLKAVEIGRGFISLTYGTAGQAQTIRLDHTGLDNGEMKKAADKFRYETGVIPQIIL